MEKAKAGRPPENRLHDETDLDRGAPTYAEMGLNKTQAHRWQTIAAMPEERFEEHIARTKARNEELTTAVQPRPTCGPT